MVVRPTPPRRLVMRATESSGALQPTARRRAQAESTGIRIGALRRGRRKKKRMQPSPAARRSMAYSEPIRATEEDKMIPRIAPEKINGATYST
jgi:hypothetical protein